ncbi:hypothetical protein FRC06_002266, partial [Ceratobasidium sp. 370]
MLKPAPKPTLKPAPKPAPKPVLKPAPKPTPKPVLKAASKPAPKCTPKPAPKPVLKAAQKCIVNPPTNDDLPSASEEWSSPSHSLSKIAMMTQATKAKSLGVFPLDVHEVVNWVAEWVKEAQKHTTDFWLVEGWDKAHTEVREGMPHIALKDLHTAFNEENNGKILKNQVIAQLIEDVFFKTPNSFSYEHLKAFTPLVHLEMIAFLYHGILSYALESRKDAFVMYMDMLEGICWTDPGLLLDIWLTITEQYLEAWLKSTPLLVLKMNLNRSTVVDMAHLEKVKNMHEFIASLLVGENAPKIKEWDGVMDVHLNGTGKGP